MARSASGRQCQSRRIFICRTGASVIQNINIDKNVMIGAGAVIISDIPNNVTVVGTPGKVIKK